MPLIFGLTCLDTLQNGHFMVKSVSNGEKIENSCELSHQRPTILILLPFDTARVRSFAKRTFHVPLLLPQSCWLHWRPRSPADSPPGFTLPTITSDQPPLFPVLEGVRKNRLTEKKMQERP